MASGLDSVTPYNFTIAFDCKVAHRPASSRKSCGTRRECTTSYIIFFTKMEVMGNKSKTKLKQEINEGGRYGIEENWSEYFKLCGKNFKQ
jgi:hypothetical protein